MIAKASIVHIIPIFGSTIQFTYIYFMQVISHLSGAVSFYIWFKYTIILVIISCVLKYKMYLKTLEFTKFYLLINTVHAL